MDKMQEQSSADSNPGVDDHNDSGHPGSKVSLASPSRESSCKCCAFHDRQPLQQVAKKKANNGGSKKERKEVDKKAKQIAKKEKKVRSKKEDKRPLNIVN